MASGLSSSCRYVIEGLVVVVICSRSGLAPQLIRRQPLVPIPCGIFYRLDARRFLLVRSDCSWYMCNYCCGGDCRCGWWLVQPWEYPSHGVVVGDETVSWYSVLWNYVLTILQNVRSSLKQQPVPPLWSMPGYRWRFDSAMRRCAQSLVSYWQAATQT